MNRLHKDDPNQPHCKREWPTKRGHQEQNIAVPEVEGVDVCMLMIKDNSFMKVSWFLILMICLTLLNLQRQTNMSNFESVYK